MIIITFDDAVNDENWSLYQKLFPETYKNPNGCPIHGTFYVSHQYSNYAMVQKLWNQGQHTRILTLIDSKLFTAGHEIAVHSISHRGPEEWWGTNATIEDWFDEMVGQANIINRSVMTVSLMSNIISCHRFGGVDMQDIRGLRVPFLSVGWNR